MKGSREQKQSQFYLLFIGISLITSKVRSNLYKKLEQYGIKIKAGVGEVVAPSSTHSLEGEESPNSKGQDGR